MARFRAPLFEAHAREGTGEPVVIPIGPLPFSVGRHPDDSFHRSVPGLWDRHLVVDWDPAEGIVGTVREGATATVSGTPFRSHRLRNGDEIQLGGLTLTFFLARPERRGLSARDVLFWGAFFTVVASEALILAFLLAEG